MGILVTKLQTEWATTQASTGYPTGTVELAKHSAALLAS